MIQKSHNKAKSESLQFDIVTQWVLGKQFVFCILRFYPGYNESEEKICRY